MRLTEHFTQQELQKSNTATRHGIVNECPSRLIPNMLKVATRLELLRLHFGRPIIVLSCYRSMEVNKLVGGSDDSAHCLALAGDVIVPGVSVLELCKVAADILPDYDQIIYEFGEWMHVGFTAGTPRKQLLTATKMKGKTVYSKGLI